MDAPSLQRLINNVRSGAADFEAALVYDVSRWGRFQDANESAYYEFIHRQAGIKPDIYNACLAALRELVETLRQKMCARRFPISSMVGHRISRAVLLSVAAAANAWERQGSACLIVQRTGPAA
jgi:hypothetical protein